MMKKYALIVLILSISAALIFWLMPKDLRAESTPSKAETESSDQNTIHNNSNLSAAQITEKVKTAQARRKFSQLDEQKLKQGIQHTELFQPSDMATVLSAFPIPLSDKQKQDGRMYIHYDPYILESKNIGDKIQFNASEFGIHREGVIREIKVDPEIDSISWSGYLENGDQNNEVFHITQTIKDNYAIGTFTTLNATYSMEVKNGQGWILNPTSESGVEHDGIHEHEE